MSEPQDPDAEVDLGRRRFFRRFAGDVLNAAGSAVGAVQLLQLQSSEAARELLGDEAEAPTGPPTGHRSGFRWDGDVCHVIDQRKMPDELVEYSFRTAAEAAFAIREGLVRGAPIVGQVAAIGLALTAGRHRTTRGYARRAQLRGAANGLRNGRPSCADAPRAVERLLDRLEAVGGALAEGDAVADALRREAEAIIGEALEAHGAIVRAGLEELPWPDDRPLRVLTHGHGGLLAGGQAATSLGIVTSAHHAGRPIEVVVAETRPDLLGARLTTWELQQAGVTFQLVTDAAAIATVAAGEVDAVLVTAERVAADGSCAVLTGGLGLALAAQHSGVPFLVVAASPTFDPRVADAAALPREGRRHEAVTSIRGTRVAPAGVVGRDPIVDAVPADLVTAIVSDRGVLRAPFEPSIDALVRTRPGPPPEVRIDPATADVADPDAPADLDGPPPEPDATELDAAEHDAAVARAEALVRGDAVPADAPGSPPLDGPATAEGHERGSAA